MNIESILQQTAKDLLNKNKLRTQDNRLLRPEMLDQAVHAVKTEGFYVFSCKTCHIQIKAPKKWIIAHHKSHARPDSKQNTTTDFNIYRN